MGKLVLLACLLAPICLLAEDADATYSAAVERAKVEYDAKVKVARDKYVIVLKVELDALTKKGDLDGAIKVRDKLALLEQQAPAAHVAGGVLGKFYTFLDLKGSLSINGKNVCDLAYHNGTTQDITLHDGDIVSFDVTATAWHLLRAAFITVDGKQYSCADMADIPDTVQEITAAEILKAPKAAITPADANANHIWQDQAIGDAGVWLWGKNPRHCRLAFVVQFANFKPITHGDSHK